MNLLICNGITILVYESTRKKYIYTILLASLRDISLLVNTQVRTQSNLNLGILHLKKMNFQLRVRMIWHCRI